MSKAFLHWALERATGRTGLDSQWEAIENSYSRPNRYYHTIEHIEEMVDFFYRHTEAIRKTGASFPSLVLAAIYHDISYTPGSSSNEEISVLVMNDHLRFLTQYQLDHIAKLILLTKKHLPDTNGTNYGFSSLSGPWLVDADLMRFAVKPDLCRHYNECIRREFQHVSDEDWETGRKAALMPFLIRDPFFYTSVFSQDDALQARQNIATEMGLLE